MIRRKPTRIEIRPEDKDEVSTLLHTNYSTGASYSPYSLVYNTSSCAVRPYKEATRGGRSERRTPEYRRGCPATGKQGIQRIRGGLLPL